MVFLSKLGAIVERGNGDRTKVSRRANECNCAIFLLMGGIVDEAIKNINIRDEHMWTTV